MTHTITSWGRQIHSTGALIPYQKGLAFPENGLIPRGLGRSYGDAALGATHLTMEGHRKFKAFDKEAGTVTVEAGLSLHELLRVILPEGYFLPVTPGTQYVTVGGAIASDVHGKNHHKEGSFGSYVTTMTILTGDSRELKVSPTRHKDLFWATIGGMGLTGVILEATVKLKPVQSAFVEEVLYKEPTLQGVMDRLKDALQATYSVAWIDLVAEGDALGRGLVMVGEHATDGDMLPRAGGKLTFPLVTPGALINRQTVKIFNNLYYHRILQPVTEHKVYFEPYFYPLDAVKDWNKVYGGKGFFQYQFVIPFDRQDVLEKLIRTISDSGLASPLVVLKTLGTGSGGLLSFPMEGWTLAVDFRAISAARELIARLDGMIYQAGGHLYLTKDALMTEGEFKASYPTWEAFQDVRKKYGSLDAFRSLQSERLGL